MRSVLYNLFVNGTPKPQPRPCMMRNGHVYNPSSADAWKEQIKNCFKPCLKAKITSAVYLRVSFFMPCPKTFKADGVSYVPYVKKPDTDNLLKSTMDALTELKVWEDDCLVYAIDASKWYAQKKTGAQIIIETGERNESSY